MDILKVKEKERQEQELRQKKQIVFNHYEQKRRKSEERAFAVGFNQIRNLITKQSMLGQKIKVKNKIVRENQKLVQDIRA